MAGMSCWFFSFPPDVVKTKVQVAPKNRYPVTFMDGGFWHVTRLVYRTHGVLGFFNGFSAITGRALVANALGFYTWELCRKNIKF